MNISLAVYAKVPAATDDVRRRFAAAVAYVEDIFPDAKETGCQFVAGRSALYNTNRLSRSWAVPIWIECGPVTVSFSAPPIPRRDRITTATYEDYVVRQLGAPGGLGAFTPNYFGAVQDADADRITVWSDLIGLGRCYWIETETVFAVSNSLAALTFFGDHGPRADEDAWRVFAALGWFGRDSSPFLGIKRLPAATLITCDEGGVRQDTYADTDALVRHREDERDFAAAASELVTISANASAMAAGQPTLALSGGRDSRLTTAAWIAAGAPAVVSTTATYPGEVERAREVLDLMRAVTGREIEHVIRNRTLQELEPLAERLCCWMAQTDGDYATTMVAHNPSHGPSQSIAVSGFGGEVAHGNYYPNAETLERYESIARPMERFVRLIPGDSSADVEGVRMATTLLEGIQADAAALGITDASVLDYFYLRERFRRWSPLGHRTDAVLPFSAPSFVRLAFDVTPRERVAALVHRCLLNTIIPGLGDIPFFGYRSAPTTDARTAQGLRIWQGEGRETMLDMVADGTAHRRYWNRAAVLERALRATRGRATNADEAVLQRVVWCEAFANHVTELRARVRANRVRPSS